MVTRRVTKYSCNHWQVNMICYLCVNKLLVLCTRSTDSKYSSLLTYEFHVILKHIKNIILQDNSLFIQPADNLRREGCSKEVKIHSLSLPLCSISSLGPHDQSLFLLTELQTEWNKDRIGLQMEVNLSIAPFPSPLFPLFPPEDT